MKYQIGQEVHNKNFHAKITGITKIKGEHPKYEYICLNCGQKNSKDIYNAEKGFGCPVCTNRIVIKGINDITTTDPWMVPYFQGGEEGASLYSKSCKKMITPKCPDCGRLVTKQTINNIYTHKGVSCVCKDGVSFPNKIIYFVMEQLLDNNQISYFDREYYIPKENKYYDMYFESNSSEKYFIEMDGGVGHGYVIQNHDKSKGCGLKAYPISMFRDDVAKEKLAESLNIKLIRIDCYCSDFEYIKNNIVNSELRDIVDLSSIDWVSVEKQSYSNLMKTVCDYKNDNPDAFVKEAASKFNLDPETIRVYWSKGNSLGWCTFNRKLEDTRSRKARKYFGQSCRVILENIKTLEQIEFDSISDFTRKNSEYFSKPLTKKMLENRFKKGNNFIENYEGYNIYKLKANYKMED